MAILVVGEGRMINVIRVFLKSAVIAALGLGVYVLILNGVVFILTRGQV